MKEKSLNLNDISSIDGIFGIENDKLNTQHIDFRTSYRSYSCHIPSEFQY